MWKLFFSWIFLLLLCDASCAAPGFHLITLSALSSTFDGIVRPICLAAFRLMMSSNFVGCSTGNSAGLVPFRIFVHIGGGAPVQVGKVHAVGHESPGFHIFWLGVYRRELVLNREICKLCSLRIEDGASQHEDCFSASLACGSEW